MWGGVAARDLVSTTHTWPKLKSLRLGCFFVDAKTLVAILRNNKETLKGLHFTGMGMRTDGTISAGWAWNRVFNEIAGMDLDHGEVFLGSGHTGRQGCIVEDPDVEGKRVVITSDLKIYFPDFGEETMMPLQTVLLDSSNFIPAAGVAWRALEQFGEESEDAEDE